MSKRPRSSMDPLNGPGANWQLRLLQVISVVTFGLLFLQVYRLQVLEGQRYARWAERIRLRDVNLPAARGVIYDRNGEILVRNVPSFSVLVVPADLPDDEEATRAIVRRLVELLGITDDSWLHTPFSPFDLSEKNTERWEAQALAASLRSRTEVQDPVSFVEKQIQSVRSIAPYRPLLIKANVSREQAFILEEEHLNLPGVHLTVEPIRSYTTGELTAHVLGYVGRLPKEQFETYAKKGYDHDDRIGLTGIELAYEDVLRGQKGVKHIEVDVAGREVRTVGEVISPTAGSNLVLTINLGLQKIVDETMREALKAQRIGAGAAIAMDPNTGEILALVSLPTYDNNLFSKGISWRDYARLSSDSRRPLVNQAISGQYPPGSTFKIVPASAALEENIITERTAIRCDGVMVVPNQYFPDDLSKAQEFVCWINKYHTGHGLITIDEALAQSCDIFFYQIGGGYFEFKGLGLERLSRYAGEFGFGQPTKIDLPSEAAGLVPSARWKRLNYSESWVTGDTYNLSIGQGFLLATPLQMLNATAAVANGGVLYRPHLVKEIRDSEGNVARAIEPEVIRRLPVSSKTIQIVQRGLRAVVERGTGRSAALAGIPVAGKTGTAEYAGPRDVKGNLPTHAWFIAYAPADHPQIALVVFIYGGGEGSEVAAPVAGKILSAYFDAPLVYPKE